MKHLSMAVVVRNGKVLVQERQKAAKGVVVEFPGGEVLGCSSMMCKGSGTGYCVSIV